MKNFNEINRASMDIGAKKKQTLLKSLLVLIGVLIGTIQIATAGITVTQNAELDFYFDASTTSANWQDHCALAFGNNTASIRLPLTHIDNTDLWYGYLNTNWSDLWWMAAYDADWGTAEGKGYSDYSTYIGAEYVSAQYSESYTIWGKHITLVTIASGDSHPAITLSDVNANRDYAYMNHTINLESYVKTGSADYAKANAKGAISATSYKIYGGNTTSEQTTASLSTSENTTTIKGCRAAHTSFIVETPESGYEFVGWFDGDGTRLSPDEEYTTYNPTTEGAYVRAYFAQTHSVTINPGVHGTVTVTGGSTGTHTIGQIGVDIEASNTVTDYYFVRWKCTGGASVDDETDPTTTVRATADGTVTAIFASKWSINGTMSNDDEKTYYDLTNNGSGIWSGQIHLSANSVYTFKVYDNENSLKYGYGASDADRRSYVGQTDPWDNIASGKEELIIMTANEGDYTFSWNGTSELTVLYPSITHPNSDYYVYFKNKPAEWSMLTAHIWGDDDVPSTSWNALPLLSTYNFDGDEYYYTALGSHTTGLVSDGSDGSDGKKTADLGFSSHTGKWYDIKTKSSESTEVAANWHDFTATLTLDKTIGTNTPSPSSITVTYGSNANLTGDVIETAPTNDNYSFAGFYTQEGGAGVKFIDASTQNVMASVPGILDAGKNWIKTGESVSMTIYAAWTQNITLDQNEATKSGSTSLAATYKATLSTGGLTEPKKIGYAFAGWTATKDGTDVVIAADGTVNEVSGWTDSDKKWIHSTSSKLYAKWTEDVNEFTGTDGVWDKATNWSAGKVPTNDYSSVTISKPVTITGASVHIGELTISASGSLTITSTGALEVEGTITNTDVEKIVVKPSGALIFNSTGSTHATIELSLDGDRWQMFAIPVGYVDVKDAFVGSNVFTFVWNNTNKVWDRRGYYDGLSAFEPVLIQGSGGYNFKGALVSTTVDQGGSATYDGEKNNGNVSMFGNSWTAPIAVSGITFTNIVASTPHVFDGSTWDGVLCNEIIPALQGFAVVAGEEGGSVTIPYSAVRAVESENRNESLKAPKHRTSETSDPIAIYISGNEWKNRIRLFESEQFSDEIDDGYEAVYIEGEGYAGELYARKTEKKMNVLATNDLEGTVVGFFPGEATNYTISFEGDGKGYYLNDVKKEEATLIAEGNTYMFTPDEGSNSARFVISKTPIAKTPTSVKNLNDGVKARKQLIDGTLYIIRDGKLYNATGVVVK